ncbi:flagellar motor switch protein FliN [Buchnera aphidicola]|uniref:flagellar motor switch protein FliN n=1 Tax=Buchnera aphidicola TaxID=9 RepID=UPI003BEEB16D
MINKIKNKLEKKDLNIEDKIQSEKNIDVQDNVCNVLKKKNIILNTFVNVTVELGKTKIKIQDFLNFSEDSILILNKLHTEPLDIFINGYLVASGEIVFLEKKYGLRITSIKDSRQSINSTV